jgi:2-phospho-L-lactate guanylyltransferase
LSPIIALLPVRAFGSGKQRLAEVLSSEARERLNRRLIARTLDTVRACDLVTRTFLVTSDEAVRQFAAARNVEVLQDRDPTSPQAGGLSSALATARTAALALHRAEADSGETVRILNLLPDLPLLEAADLIALIEHHQRTRCDVVMASDEVNDGTNAMLSSSQVAFPYHYGGGSLDAHRRECQRRGLRVEIIHRAGLAFDVDTPADLATLFEHTGRSIWLDE